MNNNIQKLINSLDANTTVTIVYSKGQTKSGYYIIGVTSTSNSTIIPVNKEDHISIQEVVELINASKKGATIEYKELIPGRENKNKFVHRVEDTQNEVVISHCFEAKKGRGITKQIKTKHIKPANVDAEQNNMVIQEEAEM